MHWRLAGQSVMKSGMPGSKKRPLGFPAAAHAHVFVAASAQLVLGSSQEPPQEHVPASQVALTWQRFPQVPQLRESVAVLMQVDAGGGVGEVLFRPFFFILAHLGLRTGEAEQARRSAQQCDKRAPARADVGHRTGEAVEAVGVQGPGLSGCERGAQRVLPPL